jgi:hypothetical protein
MAELRIEVDSLRAVLGQCAADAGAYQILDEAIDGASTDIDGLADDYRRGEWLDRLRELGDIARIACARP